MKLESHLSMLALDSLGLCEQTSLWLFPLTPSLLVAGGMSLDRDKEEQFGAGWGLVRPPGSEVGSDAVG